MDEESRKITWKVITYPLIPSNRYYISEYGDIYDTLHKRFVCTWEDKDGYKRVGINHHNFSIHRLVGWEYHPDTRDLKLQIDHLDSNKQNNHYTNLEWVTSGENTRRAVERGDRNTSGENSSTNIYPEAMVEEICQMMHDGKTNMEIFRVYSKSMNIETEEDKSLYGLIYRLRHRKIWRYVTEKYDYPSHVEPSRPIFTPSDDKNILTEDQIHLICQMKVAGKGPVETYEALNIKTDDPEIKRKYMDNIYSVRGGHKWKYITELYYPTEERKHIDFSYIDDDKLTEMLDLRLPLLVIYDEMGVKDKTNVRSFVRRINRRIENYARIKKLSKKYSELCMTEKELDEFFNWAATE